MITYIDPAVTLNKKCIKQQLDMLAAEKSAEEERIRQEQYEMEHKDDELREHILSIADELENDTLNIDFIDTKITFINVDPCSVTKYLSDKQLCSITAIILRDRGRGYIQYNVDEADTIITEIIPLKYIKKLDYIITANGNTTEAFSTEIKYKLKEYAPEEAEMTYTLCCHCKEEPSELDEYTKRRSRIKIVITKECTCYD